MKKTLLAALSALAVILMPVTASASSYNGTTVLPNSDGQTYNINASSGDTITLSNIGGSAGNSVSVTFNSSVSGTIQFVASSTRPASANGTSPTGNVNVYYDVVMNGFSDTNITSATWNFGVAKSFINSLGLSSKNIFLYHYVNGVWQQVKTTPTTSDANNYFFTATVAGFSPFAVTAVPGLSNTGFPYALTFLVAGGALVIVAASFALTRKKTAKAQA